MIDPDQYFADKRIPTLLILKMKDAWDEESVLMLRSEWWASCRWERTCRIIFNCRCSWSSTTLPPASTLPNFFSPPSCGTTSPTAKVIHLIPRWNAIRDPMDSRGFLEQWSVEMDEDCLFFCLFFFSKGALATSGIEGVATFGNGSIPAGMVLLFNMGSIDADIYTSVANIKKEVKIYASLEDWSESSRKSQWILQDVKCNQLLRYRRSTSGSPRRNPFRRRDSSSYPFASIQNREDTSASDPPTLRSRLKLIRNISAIRKMSPVSSKVRLDLNLKDSRRISLGFYRIPLRSGSWSDEINKQFELQCWKRHSSWWKRKASGHWALPCTCPHSRNVERPAPLATPTWSVWSGCRPSACTIRLAPTPWVTIRPIPSSIPNSGASLSLSLFIWISTDWSIDSLLWNVWISINLSD